MNKVLDSGFFNRRVVNLDVTYLCALECPNCQRQFMVRDKGFAVTGEHLSKRNFKKVAEFFNYIDFEGQYSDPVHHPQFIEFLEICKDYNVSVEVHNASSVKPKKWYHQAFLANPNAKWIFAIDGLPENSSKYRINQDAQKLFDIMIDAKNYLDKKPIWQYIVFKYNENDIQKAIDMACEADVGFFTIYSARWLGDNDPYMPSQPYRLPKR